MKFLKQCDVKPWDCEMRRPLWNLHQVLDGMTLDIADRKPLAHIWHVKERRYTRWIWNYCATTIRQYKRKLPVLACWDPTILVYNFKYLFLFEYREYGVWFSIFLRESISKHKLKGHLRWRTLSNVIGLSKKRPLWSKAWVPCWKFWPNYYA